MIDPNVVKAFQEAKWVSEGDFAREREMAREKFWADQESRRRTAEQRGREAGRNEVIVKMYESGMTHEAISGIVGETEEGIEQIIAAEYEGRTLM